MLPGVFQDLLGELAWQLKLVNDRQGVDARLTSWSQDLDEDPFAITNLGWETDHFEHDFVVVTGTFGARIANVDRVGEQVAIDLYQAQSGLLEIGAHETVGGPLDNIDDSAFRAILTVAGHQAQAYGVAMSRIPGILGGDVDVRLAARGGHRPFRPDESEALRRAAERAYHMFGSPLGSDACPGLTCPGCRLLRGYGALAKEQTRWLGP